VEGIMAPVAKRSLLTNVTKTKEILDREEVVFREIPDFASAYQYI
jgi:hypothetical protein